MDFSLRPKAKETQSATGIELKKLQQNCGSLMEQEQICNLMLGPEHNDCQILFLQNEDCFQRVLCFERWQDALNCLRNNPMETCERFISRSRNCKDDYFAHLLTPPLKEYLQSLAKLQIDCEEHQLRHSNCIGVLGPNAKECLDRENIYRQCVLGKSIPSLYWREWKQCEKTLKPDDDPNVTCFDELMNIRTVLHERCTNIGLSVPGITSQTFEEYGGPHNTLDALTKVFYSSHYEKLFNEFDPRFHAHLVPPSNSLEEKS